MSENVEAVRRVVDAINRADIDAFADAVSEDFEIDFSNSRSPMSGVYRGRDQARDFLQSFLEPWASFVFDTNEFIELQDGRVLQSGGLRTRGDGSGVEVEARGATVWTIRDGVAAAMELFQSKEEALEATG